MSDREQAENDHVVAALCRHGWRFYDGGGPDGDMVWVKGCRAISSNPGESAIEFDRRAWRCVQLLDGGYERVSVEFGEPR